MKPEPCCNYYATRRHLSVDLSKKNGLGRSGTALCRAGGSIVDVYDEERVNHDFAIYGSRRIVKVDNLPACKLCARIAAKMNAEQ